MVTTARQYAVAARLLRIRKGYSQAEIATRYGVAQPFISRLEAGTSGDTQAYFDFLTLLRHNDERAAGSVRAARKKGTMIAEASYELIEGRKEIAGVRKALMLAVEDAASEWGQLKLGHKANTFQGTAYYIEDLDLWTVFGSRRDMNWNTYGLGNPFNGGSRNMVCHLTVPIEGINRNMGATYARRAGKNDVYIMHRGKIGGGRAGVGKSTFWERADVKSAFVQDGDRVAEMAIVARLGAKHALSDIRDFVVQIKRIKDDATGHGKE